MGTVFAKWSPRGGRVIFAPKSPCAHCEYVGRTREEGNISSVPNICQNGGKRAKKRVSHIDGGEWAAITETASFGVLVRRRRAMSARAADVKLPSYQIFPALLFSSKNGLRRRLLRFPTSAAPRPNGWMNSLSSLCSPECGKRQLPAINAIIEDCARAPFRVQFISHCDSTASDALSYSAWLFRNSGKGCIHSPRLPTSPLPRRLPHGAVVAPLYTHSPLQQISRLLRPDAHIHAEIRKKPPGE